MKDHVAKKGSQALYRELYEAAYRLHDLRLWEEFDIDGFFMARVEGEEHPFTVNVMGQDGIEYGLSCFMGPNSFAKTLSFMERNDDFLDPEDLLGDLDLIGFLMKPRADVPRPHRKFMIEAGIGRDATHFPHFIRRQPRKLTRMISPSEAKTMLYLINGMIKAHLEGALDPAPLDEDDEVFTLTIYGDPSDPDFEVDNLLYSAEEDESPQVAEYLPGNLALLKQLKNNRKDWSAAVWEMPADLNLERPPLLTLAIIDVEDFMPVNLAQLSGPDPEEAAQALFDTMAGSNLTGSKGRPRSIVFEDQSFFLTCEAALKEMGVKAKLEPRSPEMEQIFSMLASRQSKEIIRETGGFDPDSIPQPDDLEGWNDARDFFMEDLQQLVMEYPPPSRKDRIRFFGQDFDLEEQPGIDDDPGLLDSFLEWHTFHHRAGLNGKTIAQKLLKKDLPPATKALLESRIAARPSLYRVISVTRGESVILEDLLFGGETLVHDLALSDSAEAGMVAPLKIWKAGNYNFPALLGPALPESLGEEARQWLRSQGLGDAPGQVEKNCHLFGRLYLWLEENDGPLLFRLPEKMMDGREAVYKVVDRRKVLKALEGRRDLVYLAGDDEYHWRGEDGEVRAIIMFDGKELVMVANTREGTQKARQWMDKIPGLKFKTERKIMLDEWPGQDDDGPSELSGEETAPPQNLLPFMQRKTDDYYARWLDEPLPILEGKSPRQACATAPGRKMVALLIRSLPDPSGIPGITVPRERLLRDLGLEDTD